jgi:hypothetical protein
MASSLFQNNGQSPRSTSFVQSGLSVVWNVLNFRSQILPFEIVMEMELELRNAKSIQILATTFQIWRFNTTQWMPRKTQTSPVSLKAMSRTAHLDN